MNLVGTLSRFIVVFMNRFFTFSKSIVLAGVKNTCINNGQCNINLSFICEICLILTQNLLIKCFETHVFEKKKFCVAASKIYDFIG